MYWVLFPIEDLRIAVDTAKRMLTEEKIDKQLAVQSSSTPFMNISNSQGKKVSFNMQDDLEQKIDKPMVMIDKLVTEDEGAQNHLGLRYISLVEVEIRTEETFAVDLEIAHRGCM